MNLNLFLISVVVSLYGFAFFGYLFKFFRTENDQSIWTGRLLESGFLIHTLVIFAQTFTASQATPIFHLPVTTVGEASGFFAWSLTFIYLILLRQLKTQAFALILTPVLILFLIPSFFPFRPNLSSLIYFNDTYFLLHILSAFFSYASFALSFIAAVLYLMLDTALKKKTAGPFYRNLLSLEDLEHFIFKTISWGLILLAIGILSGAFWARSAFGTFILQEPKTLSSLLTWLVYLVIIYSHGVRKIKGRRMVRMSLWAFVLVLITFLGTSLVQTGFHVGIW